MDRRQKKSREAIFNAFTSLLSEKNYNQISVQEIIDAADVVQRKVVEIKVLCHCCTSM